MFSGNEAAGSRSPSHLDETNESAACPHSHSPLTKGGRHESDESTWATALSGLMISSRETSSPGRIGTLARSATRSPSPAGPRANYGVLRTANAQREWLHRTALMSTST